MKKLLTAITAMLMIPMMTNAQTYNSLWKQVKEAEQNDLPQTEQQVLSQIATKAEKERAYGQLLKAELQHARSQCNVSPDSLKPVVERLKEREEQAAAFLRARGMEILVHSFRCRLGEIDLVARDGDTLVFVEVKSVWNNQEGNPAARVNTLKQKKIWQTACHFLATQNAIAPKGFDTPCRFDVLSTRAYQEPLQFAHYKNAFEANEVLPRI